MNWGLLGWLVAGALIGLGISFGVNAITTVAGKKKVVTATLLVLSTVASAGVGYQILVGSSAVGGQTPSPTPTSVSQRYVTRVDGIEIKFVIHFGNDGNAGAVVEGIPQGDQDLCVKIKLEAQSLGRTLYSAYPCVLGDAKYVALRPGTENADEVRIEIRGQPDVSCTRKGCQKAPPIFRQ